MSRESVSLACGFDLNDPPKEITQWLRSLDRCLSKMPKRLGLVVNYGSLSVAARDAKSGNFLVTNNRHEYLDADSIVHNTGLHDVFDGEIGYNE